MWQVRVLVDGVWLIAESGIPEATAVFIATLYAIRAIRAVVERM